MRLVVENNKDYLVSELIKIDNNTIDCGRFFNDAENALKELEEKQLLSDDYGNDLKHLLDRFSATYFSPSFMKSYMTNPALCFYSNFATEEVNAATAIGTTVHKILEEYYLQPKENRNRQDLYSFIDKYTPEGQDKIKIITYIRGYIGSNDYLDETKALDDKTLDCFCEHRGRAEVYVPKFDYQLPLPVSYIVDRIDIRDDKLYIIDYKTGYQTAKSATFDGYLSSMILYKWVIEQEYAMTVEGGYLMAPGNREPYIKLDYSLVNESKCAEKVKKFCDQFESDMKSHILSFNNNGYFTSKETKEFKEFMNSKENKVFFPVKFYLGEHHE